MISDFIKGKKPKLGSGKRFAQLSGKLSKEGVKDPKALAAYIGRKKYGKKKFGKLSAHKKSLFGMAKFEKGVPAGTRPFARRALPNEDVKQVRAKAPRYGITKAYGGIVDLLTRMQQAKESSLPTKKVKLRKSCDNCGLHPASGGLPLCINCVDSMEKARKKKPDMVDHIMRMEGPEAGEDETRHAMQQLVNSGTAWKLQGSYGRSAMDMIRGGHIALGHVGHRDYYGNYVPSRHEVQEGTKGHASFVRAAGFEPDKCGKDCPSPEVPNQLPQSIRNKKVNKAFFARFPLGPLSKTYIRVDASRAEGFVKGRVNPEMPRDYNTGSTPRVSPDATRANAPEMKRTRPTFEYRGYPQSQCPTCGKHGNALEVMRHMQTAGHIDDDQGKNKHTMIGVPELNGHTGMGTLKSMRKGMEFKVLDPSDPDYHGHTGGGAGYAGTKWVHQHGPVPGIVPLHAKENHRHFKMGAWTIDHSPSGYQEEIIGHTGKGEDDPVCSLPNCRDPLSQHIQTDDGPMGCTACNNRRPRRNVRHEFRA